MIDTWQGIVRSQMRPMLLRTASILYLTTIGRSGSEVYVSLCNRPLASTNLAFSLPMQLLNWRRPVLSTFSQEWIDAMEDLTGLDIDGDGKVGEQQPKESPPPTPKPPEKPDMIACRFQCGFEHALMEVVCHHELRGGVRSQPPSPPLLPHLRLICTRKGIPVVCTLTTSLCQVVRSQSSNTGARSPLCLPIGRRRNLQISLGGP